MTMKKTRKNRIKRDQDPIKLAKALEKRARLLRRLAARMKAAMKDLK
jgi:hypothetical protein